MAALDFKKEHRQLYAPSKKEFSLVDVPPLPFIMIDGHGNPNNNPVYEASVQALYSLAYTLKFALKKQGLEYGVPPLEGLWWMPDMKEFTVANKERWDWTMMIMQPPQVTPELFARIRDEVVQKKELPTAATSRLEIYPEGLSVQILYLGAYADEGPTIARMHAFIHENGYATNGKHHEVYLGDPRRTAPEKLRTVIRQPVREAA